MLHKQSGTAVFMALFVVTLTTVMTIAWYNQIHLSARRTQQMLISDQTYLYAKGVVDWAIGVIKTNNTLWPQTLPKTRLTEQQYVVSGRIDDYQSRLNLNSLTDKNTLDAFVRLILVLDPTMDPTAATQLGNEIVAWITPFENLTSKMSTLNEQYKQKAIPYRAANRPMQSTSELRMIGNITPELYLKLQPYISALPFRTRLNLKYGSPLLLQIFNVSPEDFVKTYPSEYFLVRADVQLNKEYAIIYTLLHKVEINKKIYVGIVWQSHGTL
jgi:general secretion pathway protein K